MKKMIGLTIFLSIFCLGLFSEQIRIFDEMYKVPSVYKNSEFLYIVNSETCEVDVYASGKFQKVNRFGKKGEGPREFRYAPRLYFMDDQIIASSMGKFIYYSKSGEFIKEFYIKTTLGQAKPLGDSFVAQSFTSNPDKKQYIDLVGIHRFDGENSLIKTLFTYKEKMKGRRPPGTKKALLLPLRSWSFEATPDHLVIGNPMNMCKFEIFDKKGNRVGNFDYNYEKVLITQKIIKSILAEREEKWGKAGITRHQQRYKYEYLKYQPPFRFFKLDGQFLYLFTHNVKDGKREILVLNFKGKLMKSVWVEKVGEFGGYLSGDKFYYLFDNPKTEKWELHYNKI